MSHYKPYPAYKDSGVEWLGKVPEGWKVKRLKYNLRHVSEKTDRRERAVALENIESWTGKFIETNTDFEGDGVAFESGDILFGKLRPYLAKAYLARSRGEAVGDVFVLRPFPNVLAEFAQYQVLSREFINTVDGSTYGAKMPRVSWEFFGDMLLPTPSKLEQQTVVAHLDRETTRIDGLVSRKTRFIELLREKRQALITHAVTKGLNPDAPMKDSGVEWLGEVPEGWDALMLRRVACAVRTGGTPSDEPPSNEIENGVAWYTPGDFGETLVLSNAEKQVSKSAIASGEAKIFPAGSVLIVSIGATLGKVGLITSQATANQQINAVLPNHRVGGYFLAYSLSVKKESMWFLANAATIGIMNQEKTKDIWLAVPPINEQLEIIVYLDRETTRIDTLISKTERSIELLKERRSALITAAVTGQIDLRETI